MLYSFFNLLNELLDLKQKYQLIAKENNEEAVGFKNLKAVEKNVSFYKSINVLIIESFSFRKF